MTALIVDTSGLLAYFNTAEPDHKAVSNAIESTDRPLVVSPYVLAELDYLVATRHGVTAELAVLTELSGGAWDLAALDAHDLKQIARIVTQYRDQQIGVADASLVVLAERYSTTTICTLDRRHFSVIRPTNAPAFDLVPTPAHNT